MDRPIESETTKIVENSYRATILAFLNEWSLFQNAWGRPDQSDHAIKMRPTHKHDLPGPGIGGYCLPKDGGLGYWSYKHILGFQDASEVFRITPTAIDINDTRPCMCRNLHVMPAEYGKSIAGSEYCLRASYRQDARYPYSGSEMIVRKLSEMGLKCAFMILMLNMV